LHEAKNAHATHSARHKGEGDLCAKGTTHRVKLFTKFDMQQNAGSAAQNSARASGEEVTYKALALPQDIYTTSEFFQRADKH